MRHYSSDSADAVARVLTLTLLADGAVDKSELDCIGNAGLLDRLNIPSASFNRVVQEFCEDMASHCTYLDTVHCRLSPDIIDCLLDDIRAPHARRALFDVMCELAGANGHVTEGEIEVLRRAAARWGLEERCGSHLASPLVASLLAH